MALEQLLQANKEFLQSGGADRLPSSPFSGWAIVTCSCPELTGLIEPALGLARGEAFVVRTQGLVITRYDNAVLRSIASAIYLSKADKVVVVGHVPCRGTSDSSKLLDGMSKSGISRGSLDADIKEWFGLLSDTERGIRETVAGLSESALIPAEIPVYGIIMDPHSGEIRVVLAVEKRSGQRKPVRADSHTGLGMGNSLDMISDPFSQTIQSIKGIDFTKDLNAGMNEIKIDVTQVTESPQADFQDMFNMGSIKIDTGNVSMDKLGQTDFGLPDMPAPPKDPMRPPQPRHPQQQPPRPPQVQQRVENVSRPQSQYPQSQPRIDVKPPKPPEQKRNIKVEVVEDPFQDMLDKLKKSGRFNKKN